MSVNISSLGTQCNRLKCSINGTGVTSLLDTGASVSCLSFNMYCKIYCQSSYQLQPSNIKSVVGVGGSTLSVKGEVTLPLIECDLQLWHKFQVLAGSHKPEVILGEDFLTEQRAKWDFSTNTVSLQNDMVSVSLENGVNNKVCFIKTTESVLVPAKGEIVLLVHVNNRSRCDKVTGVIEPTMTLQKKYQITGPRCTVVNNKGKACYRLLNPMSVDAWIPQSTVVGTFTPVTQEPTLIHMADRPDSLVIHKEAQKVATPVDTRVSSTGTLNPMAPEFVPKCVNTVPKGANTSNEGTKKTCKYNTVDDSTHRCTREGERVL